MRQRLGVLVAVLAVVATLAGCGVGGITNTGVVGFGTVPSPAVSTETPVPKGDTKYDVYFQIGDYLKAETRITKSGLSTRALYQWLLNQISQGPTAGEISGGGFSAPDTALSQLELLPVDPLNQAAAIMLSSPLSGNDLGQIICTLNGQNLNLPPYNDSFGIAYPNDPTFINWNNCSDFLPAGTGTTGVGTGSVSPSP